MAKFHFFTDIDLLNAQTEEQAFGPVKGFEATKYMVTSLHSASSNPKAYAICKGQVLVQLDDTDSTLVNIILKPETQPYNCPSVKYYIYRGILKNSLIDGNNVAKDVNTLTKTIHDSAGSPTKDILGIELYNTTNFQNNDSVDNAFYLPKDDIQLWPVDGGWSIGAFDKNKMGFEIMLNVLGFNPTFALVRNNSNIIQVADVNDSSTQAQIFDHWHKKEAVLNYLDSAAFYGNLYEDKVFARKSSDKINDALVPDYTKYKKDEIYENILVGISNGNFFNRNKVYLDIRNEFNYSLNYFRNYLNTCKFSFQDDDSNPEIEINYYRSSWPILKISNTTDAENIELIRILLPKGDNRFPIGYLDNGAFVRKFKSKILEGNSNFVEIETGEVSDYTLNIISIKIENYKDGKCISAYNKFLYTHKINAEEYKYSYNTVLRINHYLDNLFLPLVMNIPFNQQHKVGVKVYEEKIFCDSTKDYGRAYIVKRGIARDQENIILFAFNCDDTIVNRNNTSNPPIITCYSDEVDYFLDYLNSKLNLPEIEFASDIADIPIYKYTTQRGLNDIYSGNNINPNKDLIMLFFSINDFNSLIATANANFNSDYPVYLGVKKKIAPIRVNEYGEYYLIDDIVLRGFKTQQDNTINVFEVNTNISFKSFKAQEIF